VNIKTVLKTSVAAAALVAISAPAIVSQAEAGVNNGNKNSLVMSGQIARALVYQDDGNSSQLFNVDGVDTSTRIRWIVSGQMTESVAVGGVVELNMARSNVLGSAALGNTAETNADAVWGFRKTEVTFSHKAYGKLSLGQSSIAGDGTSTQSFASLGPSMSANGVSAMGASTFFNDTTKTQSTVGTAALGGFDPTREDRIRYDTPSFGGLKLAVSHQDNGQSVGANYGGKFGGVQVGIGAFYENTAAGSTTVDASMGGSVAVKHDSGLSAAFSYTKEDASTGNNIEGKNWNVQVGYAAQLTNLGTTGFGIIYNETEDGVANGDEGDSWSIAVNQNISSVGADIYAGYTRATYDDATANNFDDFSAVFAGTRLNF